MVKKKACKKCRIFVKGNECQLCKGTEFTTSWKGRIIVMDAEKSEIAQKLNIKVKGEYVIKTR